MELCHAYGIPHSHFTGAGDGRWTALDRAKALGWLAYRRAVCSGCGTRADEWRPELGGNRFAYVADASTCPGCELLAMERAQVPDGPDGRGVKIGLKPRQER